MQQYLETRAGRFKKKEIDLIQYVQDLSLAVAKESFNMNLERIFLFIYHLLPFSYDIFFVVVYIMDLFYISKYIVCSFC